MVARPVTSGFTLIELVIVITLIAILAVTVAPRLSGRTAEELQTNRDQLVSVLRLMQQQRMQNTQSSCFSLSVAGNLVQPDPSAGCNLVDSTSPLYWQASNGINLSAVLPTNNPIFLPFSLAFDRLGRPSAYSNGLRLQLSSAAGNFVICIESQGYIHPCD